MSTAETRGRAAAEAFRSRHALGDAPLGDLISLVEEIIDIDVAVLRAPPDEHALTMRDPARGVTVVALARTPHPMRQRTSIAHEVGHIELDTRPWTSWQRGAAAAPAGDWSERTTSESRADAFARHLLLPVSAVTNHWEALSHGRRATHADLSRVVQRHLVSPQVVAIQAHLSGCIDDDTKAEWMSMSTPVLATRFGWLDQYRALSGESSAHRAPQRLLARATEAYQAGVVSSQQIARLRGTSSDVVERDMSEAGIRPRERRHLGG